MAGYTPPPAAAAAVAKFKTIRRTAGNLLLLSNAAWADLPTIAATWDLALAAVVGDVIRAELSGMWNNDAAWGGLDVATIVAAAPVNYFGGTGLGTDNGVGGWTAPTLAYQPLGGAAFRTMVAGDLAAGQVTCRLRYRSITAGNRTLNADAATPLAFTLTNLGPVAV